MGLTRDQIVAAANQDHEAVSVRVPEWDGEVFVRPLTVDDQEHLDEITPTDDPPRRRALRAVLYALADEDGKPLFEATDADLEWFRGVKTKTVTRLLGTYNDVNGNLEEAVEGFEPAPPEDNATA